MTLEERVTILEAQMTDVQVEVVELNDEVAFLFDGQALQDERIFNLEEETSGTVSIYCQISVCQFSLYYFQLHNFG